MNITRPLFDEGALYNQNVAAEATTPLHSGTVSSVGSDF